MNRLFFSKYRLEKKNCFQPISIFSIFSTKLTIDVQKSAKPYEAS